MFKYEAKTILKEFYKDTRERGTKTVKVLMKKNSDGSEVIFEICDFKGYLGYGCLILDNDGYIVYDVGDGELSLSSIYNIFNNITEIKHYESFPNMCWSVDFVEKNKADIVLLDKNTEIEYKDFGDYYEKNDIEGW